MWNVTSMINKTEIIMEHLLDRDPSIVFVSETWLKSDNSHVTALVKTYGYLLIHNRRKGRDKELGGGVGILLKDTIVYKHVNYKTYSSFELSVVKIFLQSGKSLLLMCIYRVLFVSVAVFLDQIVALLEILVSSNECIIIAGDVNIHLDEDELYSTRFRDILDTFNIHQHVNFSTHRLGHTLDMIATFKDNPAITNIVANEYDVSHHFLVDFEVDVHPETRQYTTINYRNIKDINFVQFQADVNNKLTISDSHSLADGIKSYNEVLTSVLNEQAPMKSRNIKKVPDSPWFDGEYSNLRRLRRKAEKEYKRTGFNEHKYNYQNLRKQTTNLAYEKKKKYYAEKLDTHNRKTLFSVVNKLLDKNQEVTLPDANSDNELAESFMNYFINKIDIIRSKFPGESSNTISIVEAGGNKLSVFEPASIGEIHQIILTHGIKCSHEDPMPASVLKNNIDLFLPIWTKLVNMSLAQGSMECLKDAILIPFIKELDHLVDKNNLKNYRPVSNLLFVGKLIERVVSVRLEKHMSDNNLHSDCQYGYKKGHSTETLLLKVLDELLTACDNHKPTILMLLDLSAAFDTVDQNKLLEILHSDIGIEGIALKWFKSFLLERSQKVKIRDTYSFETSLPYGVPQGSVLGPNLFNIYTKSLYKYIEPSKFSIFGFADDHQLLKSFLPLLQVDALGNDIRQCFNMILKWMNEYFLCLNPKKTKILVIAPPSLKNDIVIQGSFVNDSCIRFVSSAKNLGFILDNDLSFESQITNILKSCFIIIRKLSKIKSFLSYNQLCTIICSCIFSNLDYCNSLYYGINSQLLNKLQSVQNSAVCLLRKKNGHANLPINYYLQKHHWLPVRERILFKICLLVHKCLQGNAPLSLSSLLSYSSSTRTRKLNLKSTRSSFGDRSFSKIGPKLWNLLPMKIRMEQNTDNFKVLLKTFLFKEFEYVTQKLNEY